MFKQLMTQQNVVGSLWMVIAGMTFACINTILQYTGMKLQIQPTTAAFLQYAFALVVVLPFLRFDGFQTALASKHRYLHIIRIVASVIGIQLWTWALAHVPIWQCIALVMTSPLFATLGSRIILKECVGMVRWLATLIGFIGAMIILSPWSDDFSYYALLPIGAAMFWASASLMTKYTTKDDSPITIVAYLLVLMLPINYVLGYSLLSFPSGALAWGLLVVAGLLTAFAQWAIAKAYSCADASYLQPFDHIKLPFNVLAGYLVFHYLPPGELWIGAALIIISVTLMTYEDKLMAKYQKASVS